MMRRLLLAVLVVVALASGVLAEFSVTPWGVDPPSGNWADYGIAYSLPTVNPNGLTWYVSDIRHLPPGSNGADPGNHNVYPYTYDWTGFPNDPNMPTEWSLHVPIRHVQIAYWCSGEDTPSPTNSHWVVRETWPGDGEIDVTLPATDFVIAPGNICKVAVWNPEHPEYSGIVSGISTMHPDEGDGVHYGHHSFAVSFTALEASELIGTPAVTPTPVVTATPEPTVTPVVVTEEAIREAAWNSVGVDYNPDAAFGVFARAHSLGVPLGQEQDIGNVRYQPFAGGIVWCVIGDWQNVGMVEW